MADFEFRSKHPEKRIIDFNTYDLDLYIILTDIPYEHDFLLNTYKGSLFRRTTDGSGFIAHIPVARAMPMEQEHTFIPGSTHQHILTSRCWCATEETNPPEEEEQ